MVPNALTPEKSSNHPKTNKAPKSIVSNRLALHKLISIFYMSNFLFVSFTAVKFGRMSKKQREKVEDEVRFHRAQMRAQNDAERPDSSVYDTQTPSSSDQLHHTYNGYVNDYLHTRRESAFIFHIPLSPARWRSCTL